MGLYEQRLLLGLIRSLCRMDLSEPTIDPLIYDTMQILSEDWAEVANAAAATPEFATALDTMLKDHQIKTIQEIVRKH